MSRVVLVVDDDPLVLEIAAEMLKDLGCEVTTAANAKQALAKLSADRRIEILITDIDMPGMDGCRLAETATQMDGRLKVILLSGCPIDCDFPFVQKPFSQADLKRSMAHNTGLC